MKITPQPWTMSVNCLGMSARLGIFAGSSFSTRPMRPARIAPSTLLNMTSIGGCARFASTCAIHCSGWPLITCALAPVCFSKSGTITSRMVFSNTPPKEVTTIGGGAANDGRCPAANSAAPPPSPRTRARRPNFVLVMGEFPLWCRPALVGVRASSGAKLVSWPARGSRRRPARGQAHAGHPPLCRVLQANVVSGRPAPTMTRAKWHRRHALIWPQAPHAAARLTRAAASAASTISRASIKAPTTWLQPRCNCVTAKPMAVGG